MLNGCAEASPVLVLLLDCCSSGQAASPVPELRGRAVRQRLRHLPALHKPLQVRTQECASVSSLELRAYKAFFRSFWLKVIYGMLLILVSPGFS